jgi:predicted nucleic acid-binding protein
MSNDALTSRADSFLRSSDTVSIVSDFAAAEFASAIARRVRIRDLTRDQARATFSTFDAWIGQAVQWAETTTRDVALAAGLLRRLELTLRTPDALNIAIAERLGATLATFDKKMALSARRMGISVATA